MSTREAPDEPRADSAVRHPLFLVAFALVALAGGAASASAAPTVDGTFAVSDTPGKLARGSDGSIWVVVGGSKLAKVTPAGSAKRFALEPPRRAKR